MAFVVCPGLILLGVYADDDVIPQEPQTEVIDLDALDAEAEDCGYDPSLEMLDRPLHEWDEETEPEEYPDEVSEDSEATESPYEDPEPVSPPLEDLEEYSGNQLRAMAPLQPVVNVDARGNLLPPRYIQDPIEVSDEVFEALRQRARERQVRWLTQLVQNALDDPAAPLEWRWRMLRMLAFVGFDAPEDRLDVVCVPSDFVIGNVKHYYVLNGVNPLSALSL